MASTIPQCHLLRQPSWTDFLPTTYKSWSKNFATISTAKPDKWIESKSIQSCKTGQKKYRKDVATEVSRACGRKSGAPRRRVYNQIPAQRTTTKTSSPRHQCVGTKLPTARYHLPTIHYQLNHAIINPDNPVNPVRFSISPRTSDRSKSCPSHRYVLSTT